MKRVLEQYAKHIHRIQNKAVQQDRLLTYGQHKAIAYYLAAAQTLQALIDAPIPEWVGLKFMHPQRTR
jgi:hypothetical protein